MENFQKNAKLITMRSLVVILFIFFGMIIAAQLRSIPSRVTDPVVPFISLSETRDSLYSEQAQLKNEIKNLHLNIQTAQDQVSSSVIAKKDLDLLSSQKAQAGLTKIAGPGISINLDDSKSSPVTEESIVHAADLRDTINALWGAGAEAISVNNQRIVINSAIDCIVNTILINDVRLTDPFEIQAIGNPDRLYDQLSKPATLSSIYQRKQKANLIFDVSKKANLTVPAFDGSFEIKAESVQ